MTNIHFRDVFRHPAFFLATGFGIGLIPYAPGTWGSLLGILFYLALHSLGWVLIWEVVIIVLFFFLIGVIFPRCFKKTSSSLLFIFLDYV